MMASVSSAAGLSRRGRSANCARSIASASSRRVRNCHPCAISTSSTPWSPVANAFRSSAKAPRTAAAPACGSRVMSSSTVSGRAEANSADSNSFASGLTPDLNRGDRPLLVNVPRAALGELEQGDEGGQDVHDRGTLPHDVAPAERRPLREQRLNPLGRALHVERPRHDAVQHRLRNEGDHPLRRRQQIVQVDHEGRGRRGGRLGREAPPELLGPAGRRRPQPFHELADLLILEQPAHQLGARIFPLVVAQAPRQEHLCLDPQQAGGHLEIVRRLIEPQLADHGQELVGDLRDGQVGDVDLVLADQMEQQVERAGELLQLDDEAVLVLGRGWERGHETGRAPGSAYPPTTAHPSRSNCCIGQRYTAWAAGTARTNTRNAMIGRYPNAYSCRYFRAAPGGSRYLKTWLPSHGGMGSRLKNASSRLSHMP